MQVARVQAVRLGLAFAILLGAAGSYLSSPWSTSLTIETLAPIVVTGAIGFAYGLLAAMKPRLGWIVWLLTLPAIAVLVWAAIGRCETTTPGDDCGILAIIAVGWLVPWSIGILVLRTFAILTSRAWREAP